MTEQYYPASDKSLVGPDEAFIKIDFRRPKSGEWYLCNEEAHVSRYDGFAPYFILQRVRLVDVPCPHCDGTGKILELNGG